MTTNTTIKNPKVPRTTLATEGLSWAEFGLMAYIEMAGDPSVTELADAATNGQEGLRHLLRKLSKRDLIQLTRHVNGLKRFTKGTYSVKPAA